MKRLRNVGFSFLGGALVLALAFIIFYNPQQEVAGELEQDANSSNQGGQQEGIHVNGDWTIEVTKQDGTVAKKTEFQNALLDSGAEVLSNLLAGEKSPGSWAILLAGDACTGANGDPSFCSTVESEYVDAMPTDDNVHPNLNVTVNDDGEVVLSGTVTATHDATIENVGTMLTTCGNDTASSNCVEGDSSGNFAEFTGHPLAGDEQVDVVAGQQVSITVVLSFN